jgi:hypothetical protein
MVEKIKSQNEKADDLMEQQDDMIANYKVLNVSNLTTLQSPRTYRTS